MMAPSGRQELLAGALPLMGDGEQVVRFLAGMTTAEEPSELEPVEVDGQQGWRVIQRIGETDQLTVYVPHGDVLHFFSLQPAEPGGAGVLDSFLGGVHFTAP
jgi:hypothetical protein